MPVIFATEIDWKGIAVKTPALCRRTLTGVLYAGLTVLSLGCGGSDRPNVALVSGRVTLDSAPVAGATLTFEPAESGRPVSAITDSTGVYHLNSYDDGTQGAIVGNYNVAIMKIAGDGAFKPAGTTSPAAPAKEDPSMALSEIAEPANDGSEDAKADIEYLVPQKYMVAKKSGLTAAVTSAGTDSMNFELTP